MRCQQMRTWTFREVSSSARKYVQADIMSSLWLGEERNRLRSSSKCTYFKQKSRTCFRVDQLEQMVVNIIGSGPTKKWFLEQILGLQISYF
jgi:hypothetical protein